MPAHDKLTAITGGQELTFKSTDPGKDHFECPMCKAAGRESGLLMQIRAGSMQQKNQVYPGRLRGKLYCPTCWASDTPGLFDEKGLVAVRVGHTWERMPDINPG
jgi:hypothetical protein